MKPLSRSKRRVFFIFLTLFFLVSTPFFIMRAKGWRFNFHEVFQISRTGGLYISTAESNDLVYVNGELVRKTGIVQKNVFVQDLKPGIYEIKVEKDGLQSWSKRLEVFPERVTEARSFLIAEEPLLVEIPRLTYPEGVSATSSPRAGQRNPEYDSLNAIFSTTSVRAISAKSATTSLDVKVLRNLSVENQKGTLIVMWRGKKEDVPSYFCSNDVCKSKISISAPSPVLSFDFFPGRDDLLIVRLQNGIFVSEIDDRSPQNTQAVVSGLGHDFRIKDGKELYIKKDSEIYAVSL